MGDLARASAYKGPTALKALLEGMGVKPLARWGCGALKEAKPPWLKAMLAVLSVPLKYMVKSPLSLRILW